jgi:cyclophilin family peptidyl-prolyl cis-trans isomerase
MKQMTLLIAACLMFLQASGCAKEKGETVMTDAKHPVIEMKTSLGTMKIELFSDIAPKTVENFIGLATGKKEWTDGSGKAKKSNFYDGLIFHRVITDFMIQGGCPLGNGTGNPGFSFEDECYDTKDAKPITGSFQDDETANRVFQEILVPYFRSTQSPDQELIMLVRECQSRQSALPLAKKPVEYYMQKTGRTQPLYSHGKLLAEVAYGTICMANSGPSTNGSQFFIVTKKEGCPWLNGKHTVFGKVIDGMDVALKIQGVEKGPNDKPVEDITIKSIKVVNP